MKDLFGNEEIRALWWKQPYGSLMLHGKIETRTWDTKYRGLVLICTSKKPYSEEEILILSGRYGRARIRTWLECDQSQMLNGHAIAIGRLVGCRPMRVIVDEPSCFVEYRSGLYCHVYQDVKCIEPFPLKGSQKWGKVTDEVRSKIKFI